MKSLFILFDPLFWSSDFSWIKLSLIVLTVFTIIVNFYMLYNLVIASKGWKHPEKSLVARKNRKFAAIIAAHNEEVVIAELIESLNTQNYPRELLDVYVVADNCNDRTAEIVRSMGAIVYERFNTVQRGKTWAIRDLLKWIEEDHEVDWASEYHAIAIFDADNVVHADYFKEMNTFYEHHPGTEAVQGYVDTKNPDDNNLTSVYALAYWSANPFWQLARDRWGLSAGLAGTGFTIEARTLKRIGWNPRSLTEDLEFTTQLVLEGSRVRWCEWAVVYDEKPMKKSVSYVQRTRWMQGHLWCLKNYGWKTFKAFLTSGNMRYFDMYMYLVSPGKMMLNFFLVIGGYLWMLYYLSYLLYSDNFQSWHALYLIWPLMSLYQTFSVLVMAPALYNMRHKDLQGRQAFTLKYVKTALMFWVYVLMWIPIIFKAALNVNNQGSWIRTPHTRTLKASSKVMDETKV